MTLTYAQKVKRPTSQKKIEKYGGRICVKCGFERAENEFRIIPAKGNRVSIMQSWCNYCTEVAHCSWLKNNPEKEREMQRRYRKRHPDRVMKTRRESYKKRNKTKHRLSSRRYYYENRDEVLEKARRYRADNRDAISKRQREKRRKKREEAIA